MLVYHVLPEFLINYVKTCCWKFLNRLFLYYYLPSDRFFIFHYQMNQKLQMLNKSLPHSSVDDKCYLIFNRWVLFAHHFRFFNMFLPMYVAQWRTSCVIQGVIEYFSTYFRPTSTMDVSMRLKDLYTIIIFRLVLPLLPCTLHIPRGIHHLSYIYISERYILQVRVFLHTSEFNIRFFGVSVFKKNGDFFAAWISCFYYRTK